MNAVSLHIKTILERPIFRELSWYTSAQIIVQGFSFFGVIVVSRYLGPSQLGLYAFVQNYVGAFLTIAGGMDFYFTWKIAKSANHLTDVRGYMGHKINVYVALSIIGIISAWLVLPRDVAFFVTIMLTPVFIQSLNIFSLYAVATSRAKLISVVQILTSGILFILKISLVHLGASLVWFVAVSMIDLILTGAIISFYFFRSPEWRAAFSSFRVPPFLSSVIFFFSIRASIIAIVFWQYLLRVDQLVLATFSNAHTLGIYSAAVKVAEVPNFLAGVLSTALVSRIAYISTKEDVSSKNKLEKMIIYYLAAGIGIAILVIIFAPLAINILYGAKFIESIPVLRAYALTIPGMFLTYFFIGIYGARDRYHHQAVIFGVSLVVNIILIYLLTPLYGLVGTALATAIAYTSAALGFYINLERKK